MGRQNVHQELRRGAWTAEEDELLQRCVQIYGPGKWSLVPKRAGLRRCRKSCRLRWLNYLSPGIKRGRFSEEEDDLILRLHRLLGNRWSLISGRLPGRTANDVKNYWNSHFSKRIQVNKMNQGSCRTDDSAIIKPQPHIVTANWSWPQSPPSTVGAKGQGQLRAKKSTVAMPLQAYPISFAEEAEVDFSFLEIGEWVDFLHYSNGDGVVGHVDEID